MSTSSVPTSCTQIESTVISAPIDTVWNSFRELKLADVAPGYVKSTETSSGSGVGSVVKVTYVDGTVWELLITEISDRNTTVAYRLLSSTPELTYTAAEGELLFDTITDGDHTYLKWTTTFSNDADAQVIQDQKYKKQEFFNEFKKNITGPNKKPKA